MERKIRDLRRRSAQILSEIEEIRTRTNRELDELHRKFVQDLAQETDETLGDGAP
jgi:molecular chaperone GrpE (heat shock protein)